MVAGSRLHYSNVGFALLGEVVARLRGAPWEQVLQERILDPLGLSRTGVAPSDPAADGWAVHPHADVLLREPAVDIGAMGPCASAVVERRRSRAVVDVPVRAGRSVRGCRAELRKRWRRCVSPPPWWTGTLGTPDSVSVCSYTASMGGAWWDTEARYPGSSASVWAEPDTGDGVVVLTNSTSGVPVGEVADDLLRLLADREPALPAPWQPAPVEAAVLELAGTWYWGPTAFTVTVVGSADLRLAAPGSSRTSTFHPAGRDTWIGQDAYYAGETLRAVRDQDGRLRHLDVATFVFTREPYEPAAAIPGGVDEAGWHTPGQAESEASVACRK